MKILVVGDLHFKRTNIQAMEHVTQGILNLTDSWDIVVILGDINDTHDVAYMTPYNKSIEFLSQLSSKFPVYLLMGNHDRRNNIDFLSSDHFYNSVKLWPNITVIDQPTPVTVQGNRFTLVPYVPQERFMEALNKDKDWKQSCCIFAHQEFPKSFVSPVLIVSGHIHDYEERENLIYVGSPIQHSFIEREDKSVLELCVDKNSLSWKRIFLPVPLKKTVTVTVSELSKLEIPQGQETKLIVQGSREQLHRSEHVKELKKQGVPIAYRYSQEKLHADGNYRARLWKSVKGDAQMKKEFSTLFDA